MREAAWRKVLSCLAGGGKQAVVNQAWKASSNGSGGSTSSRFWVMRVNFLSDCKGPMQCDRIINMLYPCQSVSLVLIKTKIEDITNVSTILRPPARPQKYSRTAAPENCNGATEEERGSTRERQGKEVRTTGGTTAVPRRRD